MKTYANVMVLTIVLFGSVEHGHSQGSPAKAGPSTLELEIQAKLLPLIQKLDANSLAEREAAEEQLIKIPQAEWDALGFELPIKSETKQRLERIRQTVETKHAIAGVEASRVTLKAPKTLGSAILSLEAQTGNSIAKPDSPEIPIELTAEDVPFWKAMDLVLDRSSLDVASFPKDDEKGLQFVDRNDERPLRSLASYSGVFRFEANTVTARGNLVNPSMGSVQIDLGIAWEPRLSPIRISMPMSDIRCQLDTGEEIQPETRDAEPEAGATKGTYQTEIAIRLPRIPRGAKEIAKLSGRIKATLPGRLTTLRVPLTATEPVHRGAMTLKMDGIRKAGILDEVRFRLKIDDPADSLHSHQTWVFENEAYIVDGAGERRDRVGLEVYYQSQDEVGIALLFELDDKKNGAIFVYETPLAIVAAEWPFQLQHIPLP